MKWKFAGVMVCVLSLLGCTNDVEKPEPVQRVVVDTPRGKVMIQNPVQNLTERYVTADVVANGTDFTFRLASSGDGAAVTGGVAELLDASGQLLFSIETLLNTETGEMVFTQATPEDYLTHSIRNDEERVWEHYDANGDVASFVYPLLPDDTQRRAANYYEHGLPASKLPAQVGEFVTQLGAFDAYYEPHATSTLHDNPHGELLVQILTSSELEHLVVEAEGTETEQWRWIEQTCSTARACQTLVCYSRPTSLVCFACTAVSIACAIMDMLCNWFGC